VIGLTSILVTGASGFVGRAVCGRALLLSFKVKGSHRSVNSGALVPEGVEKLLMASIDGDTDWSNALDGVDTVIHLAGRVHVLGDPGPDELSIYRRMNTAATERLARMAATRARRFVYVSTIKVNGEETFTTPFTESDTPKPQDAYAISKWEAEQVLRRIGAETGLEVVILRPPLVYGEGVGANFGRLIRLVERRIPLPLRSVANRRSLLFVKNLADAILWSISHPKAVSETFLLSDGEDISTPELVRRMADAMKLSTRMFWFPSSLLTVSARIAGKSAEAKRLFGSLTLDSTKFRLKTGWAPSYTLSQGIKETVAWYLANKSTPDRGLVEVDGLVEQSGAASKQ
jgi:nucleoside-diphosphate-sugar epimerase